MRKINIIALLLMALIAFVGCDDEDNYLKLNEGDFVRPTFQVDLNEGIVVTQRNLTEVAGTWQWTAADFGVPSEVSYQVQIATDKEMTDAQDVYLYTEAGKSIEFTIQTLNEGVQALLPEGAKPADMVETTYYLVVKAYLGTQGVLSPLFSDVVEVKFTPLPIPKTKGILYVVGGGLIGWDNQVSSLGNHLQVMFADDSKSSNLKYTYTASFKGEGGLKFPTIAGDWDTAYASDGKGALIPENKGEDAVVPEEKGVYTMTVDLVELTVSFEKYEGKTPIYETIGIVGDAAEGWDSDVEMTRFADHVWVAKNVKLKEGGLKFRADKKWGTEWAGKKKDAQLPFDRPAEGDEVDNIMIEVAGDYYVSLNSLTGHYVIIPMSELPVKGE